MADQPQRREKKIYTSCMTNNEQYTKNEGVKKIYTLYCLAKTEEYKVK
jgi:hypothetical protein